MGAARSYRRSIRGFTLVELMMVVAIIGVLAAIAMPLVYQNQLKAKKAEIVLNLDGLADAAIAYGVMFDTYGTSSTDFQPGPYFDKAAHPWDDGTIPQIFVDLGWMPDGDIRASYYYTPTTRRTCSSRPRRTWTTTATTTTSATYRSDHWGPHVAGPRGMHAERQPPLECY